MKKATWRVRNIGQEFSYREGRTHITIGVAVLNSQAQIVEGSNKIFRPSLYLRQLTAQLDDRVEHLLPLNIGGKCPQTLHLHLTEYCFVVIEQLLHV